MPYLTLEVVKLWSLMDFLIVNLQSMAVSVVLQKCFMVLVPVVSGHQLSFALSHFRPEKWILIAAKSIGTY